MLRITFPQLIGALAICFLGLSGCATMTPEEEAQFRKEMAEYYCNTEACWNDYLADEKISKDVSAAKGQ